MAKPFISIVTITLNAGRELHKTIKSVAQQSYHHYEHIIKDGGTTDNSVASAVLN